MNFVKAPCQFKSIYIQMTSVQTLSICKDMHCSFTNEFANNVNFEII